MPCGAGSGEIKGPKTISLSAHCGSGRAVSSQPRRSLRSGQTLIYFRGPTSQIAFPECFFLLFRFFATVSGFVFETQSTSYPNLLYAGTYFIRGAGTVFMSIDKNEDFHLWGKLANPWFKPLRPITKQVILQIWPGKRNSEIQK